MSPRSGWIETQSAITSMEGSPTGGAVIARRSNPISARRGTGSVANTRSSRKRSSCWRLATHGMTRKRNWRHANAPSSGTSSWPTKNSLDRCPVPASPALPGVPAKKAADLVKGLPRQSDIDQRMSHLVDFAAERLSFSAPKAGGAYPTSAQVFLAYDRWCDATRESEVSASERPRSFVSWRRALEPNGTPTAPKAAEPEV